MYVSEGTFSFVVAQSRHILLSRNEKYDADTAYVDADKINPNHLPVWRLRAFHHAHL